MNVLHSLPVSFTISFYLPCPIFGKDFLGLQYEVLRYGEFLNTRDVPPWLQYADHSVLSEKVKYMYM